METLDTPSCTRRNFLVTAALTAGLSKPPSLNADDDDDDRGPGRQILAYVGTYTPNGQGIYLMQLDTKTGTLTQVKLFPFMQNPSWLAFNPLKTHLYSADEVSNFQGSTFGAVTAWSINPSTGDLTMLNRVSSRGAGPAHLSVHPSGRYVLVANYGGGNVAVLPIRPDGSLGEATDTKQDIGSVGPPNAVDAPPGSFAISGHDAPHAHMIESDPSGRYVYWADLGQDRVYISQFNLAAGTLSNPTFINTSAGAGPRHFAFHTVNPWFYLLNEESSTVSFYIFDPATGGLIFRQTLSTLPRGFAGTNFTSEIRVSADGRFVYCANRLHDTIAIFGVERDGTLEYVDEEWTRGDYPRSFTIDPTGDWLFACNQRSDHITGFRVRGSHPFDVTNGKGSRLEFTGQYVPVGSPAIIIFLT